MQESRSNTPDSSLLKLPIELQELIYGDLLVAEETFLGDTIASHRITEFVLIPALSSRSCRNTTLMKVENALPAGTLEIRFVCRKVYNTISRKIHGKFAFAFRLDTAAQIPNLNSTYPFIGDLNGDSFSKLGHVKISVKVGSHADKRGLHRKMLATSRTFPLADLELNITCGHNDRSIFDLSTDGDVALEDMSVAPSKKKRAGQSGPTFDARTISLYG